MKHNYARLILTIFLTLVLQGIIFSQTCFIQLSDATGIEYTQEQLDSLEAAACELVQTLPTQFQNDFKVYDFGFYRYNADMVGGVEAVWSNTLQNIASNSTYFLAYGKEIDADGSLKEIHVNLELPYSDVFSCLDSTAMKKAEQTIRQAIFKKLIQDKRSPNKYTAAKISGMRILEQIVADVKNGNCCVPSDEVVPDWLISEGFVELNISCNILGPLSTVKPTEPNNIQKSMNGYVTDFANLSIEINGIPVVLKDEINSFITSTNLGNSNPIFFIISNSNICNGDYYFAENKVITNLPSIGGIIYLQDRLDGEDKIYIRLEGVKSASIPRTYADNGSYTPPPPGGATSFQDLIITIREAEDSLISHGYYSIEERIKILRGIYYGTTWSMDFEQPYGSLIRNAGFKAYLCTALDPINPEQILGTALYNKLKRSPEVTNGNLGIDFGHIIIGLEARLSWCSREISFVDHESTGLEITTWIGDIGGGAGMLSYFRVINPNKSAMDMFSGKSNFGGWINLEGDVAAYLIARDPNNFDSTPSIYLGDNDYISDAIRSYLIPQSCFENCVWNRRSELFLSMLGAKYYNGQIINEESMINRLSSKVENFAENYVINMALSRNSDSNPSNDVNLYDTSKHLKGASKEMTEIFVHTLENAMNNPSQRIQAQGFGPKPTPTGEPYTKYKAFKKTKELIKEFEDWLKN